MPYIKQERRDVLDPAIMEIFTLLINLQLDDESNNMEENMNYIFTKLLKQCYGDSAGEINDALGVLSAVQLEFFRRVAAPIYDQKIYDNGDVDRLP